MVHMVWFGSLVSLLVQGNQVLKDEDWLVALGTKMQIHYSLVWS